MTGTTRLSMNRGSFYLWERAPLRAQHRAALRYYASSRFVTYGVKGTASGMCRAHYQPCCEASIG